MTEVVTANRNPNLSDYMKVLQQIDAEFVANWRALYGFSQNKTRAKNLGYFTDIQGFFQRQGSDIGSETKSLASLADFLRGFLIRGGSILYR